MNKKISRKLWFHIVFQNYGKRAFYIPIFVIGIPATIIFILKCGSFGGIVGVVLGSIWGVLIARLAAPAVGEWFGNFVYAPKEYLKAVPEILSPIKGRIAREEYDEAVKEINELLEEKPFSPEPYLLLVEIYANNLYNYRRAMELIENYFNQEIVYIFDENIDMLLLYADICQEHNYLKKAEHLLAQEVARKGYPEIKRKRLRVRLEAVEERLNGDIN